MRPSNGDELRQFQPRSQGGLAPLDSSTHQQCYLPSGGRNANPCPAGTTGPLTRAELNRVTQEANAIAAWWAWAFSEDGRNARADQAARSNGARGTCSPTGIFYAESGGNWRAQNPTSSASGGFQFIDGTWNGYGGYGRAIHAPPYVQWEKFLQTWANGAGRGHWAASVC